MRKIVLSSALIVFVIFLCCLLVGCGNNKANLISEEDAKNAAVEQLDGFTVDDVSSCTFDEQDSSNKKYNVQFKLDYVVLTVSINAEDGSTLKIASETEAAGKSDNGAPVKDLGVQGIEKIVTEKVEGSKESDVYYCYYVDGEDIEPYYIVELCYNDKLYEFNVKASTGEILKQEVKDLSNFEE